jgi:hypothetical protein
MSASSSCTRFARAKRAPSWIAIASSTPPPSDWASSSREGEKLLGELRAPVRRGQALIDQLGLTRLARGGLEAVEHADHDHQEIVEVVRDAAGELAYGLELLGLDARPFGEATAAEIAQRKEAEAGGEGQRADGRKEREAERSGGHQRQRKGRRGHMRRPAGSRRGDVGGLVAHAFQRHASIDALSSPRDGLADIAGRRTADPLLRVQRAGDEVAAAVDEGHRLGGPAPGGDHRLKVVHPPLDRQHEAGDAGDGDGLVQRDAQASGRRESDVAHLRLARAGFGCKIGGDGGADGLRPLHRA